MIRTTLSQRAKIEYEKGRRLVVPFMGFPGLSITGVSIKLAQQNYGEHFRAVKALADRFEPDVIFPLMDLSVEANALGRYTVFPKNDSATVPKDTYHLEELERLRRVNISYDMRLIGYVKTMQLMNIGLPGSIARGAYVAGPYSLAALIMGADDAAISTILEPEKLHELCQLATESIQQYIRLLIGAGAEIICILEPSAVMLGPDQFSEFSTRYVRHLAESCRYNGVNIILHVCGDTMHLIELMAGCGANAISLDGPETGFDLPAVAGKVPEDVAVIGNISSTRTLLNGSPEEVVREVSELLESMEAFPNFILATGCDLPQETPLENISAFIKTARMYRIP